MSQPLPQFLRLVAKLRSVDQPLVLVRGWPGGGREELLAGLADSVPVRYADQRQNGPVSPAGLKEILSDAGRSSGCWFVIDGEIVVRPMMYLALTYDHRIVDGKEAVQFLVTIKNVLEDPARLLLGV